MGLQSASWIMDILRTIFAWIDWIVYSMVKIILFGIFDLSRLTTSSGLMNGIYSRIYVILGIFMAFKLSFSFFQYIVDPESMSGKSEKGVSKLISRAIIMLLVLVSVPNILFSVDNGDGLIQRAQNAFLPMLPRILLGINEDSGVSVSNGNNTDDISSAANMMAISSLQAFFAPSMDLDSVCGQGTYADTPSITSLSEFLSNINLTCNVGINVNLGPIDIGATRYYKYTYTFIVSTIVGILMVLMLLGITIDVAKRIFKMIILEAIAPIPIMSLIDPKSSKDGAFSHWLKALITTFLDIFLKLGILYVVIMLIQLIISNGLFKNFPSFAEDPLRGSYLIVILIIGLIFFAREAPKFIKDALGIKDSGAGLGTGLGAAVGALGGLVGGHGLSGMLTGAAAGATADPKQGAWAAGRDTAGKIRTGDKNYTGGLGASLQKAAVKRQGIISARKFGITGGDNGTLKRAKNYMMSTESAEQMARMAYEEAVQKGADDSVIENLRSSYISAQDVASKAKKDYETMSKVAESFGLSETKQAEVRRKNFHRATRKAVNFVEDKIPVVGYGAKLVDRSVEYVNRGRENANERKLQQIYKNESGFTYGAVERDNDNNVVGGTAINDSENRMNENNKRRDDLKHNFFKNNDNNNH